MLSLTLSLRCLSLISSILHILFSFKDERLLDELYLKKCGRRVMEVYFNVVKEYNDRIKKEEAVGFFQLFLAITLFRHCIEAMVTPHCFISLRD